MKRSTIFLGLLLTAVSAAGHDMFLVVPQHHLPEASRFTISLFNGSFEKSENTIDRERMVDVSVVDGVGRPSHPEPERWREEGKATLLDLEVGVSGTWLVGVSTRARMIELTADEFSEYLEHDGVLDVLAARRRDGALDRPVRERYAKHVKTILRVGERSSQTWSHRFGYPVEIVPLADPADLAPGDTLEALVLADGEPVAGQLVYASYAGYGGEGSADHREAVSVRTDETGVARVPISQPGRWYLRLIRMLPVNEEGVDYESQWATLTFEVE